MDTVRLAVGVMPAVPRFRRRLSIGPCCVERTLIRRGDAAGSTGPTKVHSIARPTASTTPGVHVGDSVDVAEPDGRTNRRPGRAAILDAAAARFADATLDQVVGAVAGVRDVAAAAGLAPATINHHFPPGGDRRNTRLAEAALAHALGAPDDERAHVARHLALAVAPRSPAAVEILEAANTPVHEARVAALEVRLAADARRPCNGLSEDGLAVLLGALEDGLRALARHERGIDVAIDGLVALVLDRCTDPAATGAEQAT